MLLLLLSAFLGNCLLCRDHLSGDVPLWLGSALLIPLGWAVPGHCFWVRVCVLKCHFPGTRFFPKNLGKVAFLFYFFKGLVPSSEETSFLTTFYVLYFNQHCIHIVGLGQSYSLSLVCVKYIDGSRAVCHGPLRAAYMCCINSSVL